MPNPTPPILIGGNGQYELAPEPLGGGQTALVYKATVRQSTVTERIGQSCAIKLMLPGLDEETKQRFRKEERYLGELKSRLSQIELKAITHSKPAKDLVPEIWDGGNSLGQDFLVMTLARGVPVDEILRGQEAISEPESLTLIYQLAAVFVALHEQLRRGYHDFQPRNIFWDKEKSRITVIDWNLLSGEQPEGEESPLYAQDRRIVLGLLYRLLVGVDAPGATLVQMAAPAGWARLSPVTQLLLQDLMVGRRGERLTTYELFEEIGRTLQLHNLTGDALVMKAADIHDKSKELSGNSDPTAKLQRIRLLHQTSALLSLAEVKGISPPRMTSIAQGLREDLKEQTGKNPSQTHIEKGQTFLGAGDRTLAREFFTQAVIEADSPSDQLLAWRWWILAQNPPKQKDVKQVKDLLTSQDGLPRQGEEIRQALSQIEWPGMDRIMREMEIQEILQGLLCLDLAGLEQEEVKAWDAKSAEALTSAQDSEVAQLGVDAFSREPYQIEGNSYGDCLWQMIAHSLQLADADSARTAVNTQREALKERIERLKKLEEQLQQDSQNLGKAIDMLAGDVPDIDPRERALHRHILAEIPQWMENTSDNPTVHDEQLKELLGWLKSRVVQDEDRTQVEAFHRQLSLLQEVIVWLPQTPKPPQDPPPSTPQDLSGPAQEAVESAEDDGARAEPEEQTGGSPPVTTTPKSALDYAFALLEQIQEHVPHAHARRHGLVAIFVERCLTHSYTSPLIEIWLGNHYPDQKKLLLDGLDYQTEIAKKRRELVALESKLKAAEGSLRQQIQKQEREAKQAADAAEQAEADLQKKLAAAQKDQDVKLSQERKAHEVELVQERKAHDNQLAQERKAHDDKLIKERKDHEAQIADLENRITELQSQIDGLDAHYQQETTRREAALKRQLAEKQKLLDGLAARYKKEEQAMEQRLAHLKEGVQTKQGERTDLETQVNKLVSEKNTLESDLRNLRNQAATARANRAAYEEQAQAAEQKLKTSRESARNMDQTLGRLAREVKDLEQEQDRLQAQVAQARQSFNNTFYSDQPGDVIPSGTRPRGSGIVGRDTRDAQNARTLFPPSSKPAQTTQAVQSEAMRQINKLLAAAESIGIGQGDATFPERLAGKLRRDAETEQRSMQGAMHAYSTALTKVENLGHLYRVLAYLASTHNTPPVLQDMYAVQSIWDEARSEFRKHWGRDQ